MKRFGWLVLLISLGVNLGLGYRLLNPPVRPEGQWSRETGPGAREYWQGKRDDRMRLSHRDSSQWRRIMADRLRRVADRLELTPEQVAVFQATHAQNAAGLLAQRRRVSQAREHLRAVIASQAVDADSMRLAIQTVGRQQGLLDSLITESMLLEMEILDPEQRAQYLKILPVFDGPNLGRGAGRGGHSRRQ